jgi:intein/homing endonuclease
MAAILYATLKNGVRIGIIAPTYPKTKIIMNYVADLLASNPAFDQIVMVDTTGLTRLERLRKEVNKQRITFRNGSSIEIKSVDMTSKGFGVTGFAYSLCLPAGVMLTTDRGKVPVEEVVGKRMHCNVLSLSEKGRLEFRRVSKHKTLKATAMTTIRTKTGSIACTANHPIYVNGRGFVHASEIKKGDEVGMVGFG